MHSALMQLTTSCRSASLAPSLSHSPLVSALPVHQLQLPMAATHSSARGAMGASLVLVLLLAAVASAQAGSPVSFENKCGKAVKINGVVVDVNLAVTVIVDLKVGVTLSVIGGDGQEYSTKFLLPADVKAVVLVYDGVYIKVKVKAVNFLLGLVHTLVGLVVVSLKVVLFLH